MSYVEELKDKRWINLRNQIVKRDGCCKLCSSEYQLHVHHRIYYYDRKAWEYEEDELITLCKSCHDIFHLHRKPKFVGFNKEKYHYLDIKSSDLEKYSSDRILKTENIKKYFNDYSNFKITTCRPFIEFLIKNKLLRKSGRLYKLVGDKSLKCRIFKTKIEIDSF